MRLFVHVIIDPKFLASTFALPSSRLEQYCYDDILILVCIDLSNDQGTLN